MGFKLWLKLVPVFSLSKQQPMEPGVKSLHPTSPSHEQKGEEGWGRLWEPRRAASHPTVILTKLDWVFWVEPMACSTSKVRGKGLEPGVTSIEWIHACNDDETWWA